MDASSEHTYKEQKAPDGRKIYNLLEIAASISSVISKTYNSSYWIKAEIVKLNYYPKNGHCYPDLVEKKDGLILAEMKAIIWATDYPYLSKKFFDITKNKLNEGMSILFRAEVKYHAVYGLSLFIQDIEPSFSLGEMARDKIETIGKLKKELLFDRNKKIPFPLLPKKIAVVSVESSKGYKDFLSILKSNKFNYSFLSALFPAILQGDKAVGSIISQLKKIEKIHQLFDVVVIIRGGGGDTGLNCYDNYLLSREVAMFPIPVITGIGHSTNQTVVEMISNTNKITPTDVAYFIIGKFRDFDEKVIKCSTIVSDFATDTINSGKEDLENYTRMFRFASDNLIGKHKMILNTLDISLKRESVLFTQRTGNALRTMVSGLKYKPHQHLLKQKNELLQINRMLPLFIRQQLQKKNTAMNTMEDKIKLLDPINVIKRGFSITYVNGKILRNSDDVKTGDVITTELGSGILSSKVVKITNDTIKE